MRKVWNLTHTSFLLRISTSSVSMSRGLGEVGSVRLPERSKLAAWQGQKNSPPCGASKPIEQPACGQSTWSALTSPPRAAGTPPRSARRETGSRRRCGRRSPGSSAACRRRAARRARPAAGTGRLGPFAARDSETPRRPWRREPAGPRPRRRWPQPGRETPAAFAADRRLFTTTR